MKQRNEHIEELLGKFLEGQTTETEEQMLSDFFCKENDVPKDWQVYKEMFQSFKTDAFDFCEDELDTMLHASSIKKTSVFRLWPWASAACVAATLALFILHPWKKNEVDGKNWHNQAEAVPTTAHDISTSEMMETIHILTDLSPDDAIITVSPSNEGFAVNTSHGNSYTLKRCADGSSLELLSQSINF